MTFFFRLSRSQLSVALQSSASPHLSPRIPGATGENKKSFSDISRYRLSGLSTVSSVDASKSPGSFEAQVSLVGTSKRHHCRSWQGSNLRGQCPMDFKSNALTTRPQLLWECHWKYFSIMKCFLVAILSSSPVERRTYEFLHPIAS